MVGERQTVLPLWATWKTLPVSNEAVSLDEAVLLLALARRPRNGRTAPRSTLESSGLPEDHGMSSRECGSCFMPP